MDTFVDIVLVLLAIFLIVSIFDDMIKRHKAIKILNNVEIQQENLGKRISDLELKNN